MELLNQPMFKHAILVTTGICSGFISSMAAGGSLLTLPVLIFLGLDGPTVANGTNRVALVIQNAFGIASFRRKGISDFRYGILISVPTVCGVIIGTLLVIQLGTVDKSSIIFNRILAGIMIIVLAITIFNPLKKLQSSKENLSSSRKVLAALIFFFLGIYIGFIQAGVGFMIIMTITTVNGFSLVRTNALKMFVVFFGTLIALLIFVIEGHVDWGLGLALAGGNSIGVSIGSHWAVAKGDKTIRIILVCSILVFSARLIWKSFV
ncbi:MAG: sulfite exporter TauE/SafE family protein [Candidatus Poribacteria bacterium]|nr:sulfite exporter TauE/SafE family protein [Candidatus Poribacteria bacterium]